VDPFELAWEFLLKAPVDLGSIVYSPRDPNDPFSQDVMTADFVDDETSTIAGRELPTGRTFPMRAVRDRFGNINSRITDPSGGRRMLGSNADAEGMMGLEEDIAEADFSAFHPEREGDLAADNAFVDRPFRGRGLGRDMYGLAASLAERTEGGHEEAKIVPSANQSQDAMDFWRDRKFFPPLDSTFMTIRSSEPMKHAFSSLRKIK
jgi:GNAT superfamily N-acetyltransferase